MLQWHSLKKNQALSFNRISKVGVVMAVDEVNHLDVPEGFRIPLARGYDSRTTVPTSKDQLLKNCYIEQGQDKKVRICKRPGFSLVTSYFGGGAATAQGLYRHNGFILAASNNQVTRLSSPTSAGYGTAAAWANTTNGPWVGRSYHASVVFNGALFVIGGTYDGTNGLRDIWSTSDGENWVQLSGAAPWGQRWHQEAVVFNNRLYIMGGVNNGVFFNDVWVTDNGVDWTLVTASAGWAARSSFGAVAFNNGIYVVGGNLGGTEVWFTTDGSNWVQQVTGVFGGVARISSALVVHNNTMFVLGGVAGGRDVWSSTDGRTWSLLTNVAFSSARYDIGACAYNGRIYVVGGFTGAGEITEVWSSADGIAWVQATAAYGGPGIAGNTLAVFRAPPALASAINAPVLYSLGGRTAVPSYLNQVYYTTLDGTLSSTYGLSGAVLPYLPMQGVSVNNNETFAIKDTRSMWVWKADQWQRVVDKNYPQETVPGVVNLDETVYVMDPDGLIRGSAITDAITWPSLNFIGADFKSDPGTCLAQYSNFVVAFGTQTMQMFYNSGAPGRASLLRPMKNQNINIGCLFPYTAVTMENTLVWVGRAEDKGAQVFAMQGQSPIPISNQAVEMALDAVPQSTQLRGTSLKLNGHAYYILSCSLWTWGALVYDFTVKNWYLWDNAGGVWRYNYSVTDGDNNYILRTEIRQLCSFDTTIGDDQTDVVTCLSRTTSEDQNTSRLKFCARATVIGDWTPNATVRLRWSDNDGNTWSNWRSASSYQQRVSFTRLGSYRSRIWEIEQAGATIPVWRVHSLELELNLGK
jgi:hypothetical protein